MIQHRYYAVQHVPSGLYLPAANGRNGRGGSHVEPSDERPRLFPTERGAKNYLASWLKGKYVADRGEYTGGPDWDSEFYERIELIPQPHRKREEMAVVSLVLVSAV